MSNKSEMNLPPLFPKKGDSSLTSFTTQELQEKTTERQYEQVNYLPDEENIKDKWQADRRDNMVPSKYKQFVLQLGSSSPYKSLGDQEAEQQQQNKNQQFEIQINDAYQAVEDEEYSQIVGRGAEIIIDFKVDGMTCVACSRTLENAMTTEFQQNGLKSVQIALLTHKMRMIFDLQKYQDTNMDTDKISDEVTMVGFSADLLEMIENNQEELLRQRQNSRKSSYNSNQSGVDIEVSPNFEKRAQAKVIKACTLIISGMTCASCQQTIENHLKTVPGIVSASVSLLTHKATLKYKPNEIGIRSMIDEVECLGFDAKYEAQSEKSDIRVIVNEAVRRHGIKFFVSLGMILPILVLIYIIPYTKPEFITDYTGWNGIPLYVYLNAIFATIIQVVMGAQFYINSFKALRNKSANMDVLIMMGTTAAWLYGVVNIGIGYDEHDMHDQEMFQMMVQELSHNFEISSALITIILLGKYLEAISKKKTVEKLSQLASLKITKAHLVDISAAQKQKPIVSLDMKTKDIEVDLLQVGDLVLIYPGEGIPVDGLLIFGKGICNEAMLTGEAKPIHKDIGSSLFGGSILIQGQLIMKVTKTAENSSINQIIKLVENAQNARAPIQGLADRISQYFVPLVILLTLITWCIWFSITYSDAGQSIDFGSQTKFEFAFSFGISTLVIACPCALGLATPTAVMVGTGIAASFGVLIKGGDVLEKISSITTIVFDKTGTLTSGTPQVKDLISIKEHFKLEGSSDDKDFMMYLTYLAEKGSEHPLAKAIVKKIASLIPSKIEEMNNKFNVKEFKNRDGEGVVALINDKQSNEQLEILCGNDKLTKAFNIQLDDELKNNIDLLEQEGLTVILVSVNRVPQLILSLEETHLAKPESREVVNYLRKVMKLRVAMITGDNQHAAYKVARHLGIDTADVVYKAYPEDKKKAVERFQKERKEIVMFVGDGINDSPVLAQADVGVAINSGSEITVNAAGIVLMKDNLYDVVNAIRISRSSFRRIKINFVWAFLYNILLIPIAMGVLYPASGFRLDPMLAGGAMAASSISVVLSSLMLKIFKPIYKLDDSYKKKLLAANENGPNAHQTINSTTSSNGNTQNTNEAITPPNDQEFNSAAKIKNNDYQKINMANLQSNINDSNDINIKPKQQSKNKIFANQMVNSTNNTSQISEQL